MAPRKPAPLPFRGVRRAVMDYIINRIAFANYDECCNAPLIAEELGKDPRRFKATLKRLAAEGWVTFKGRTRVYPTVAALRWANPELSTRQAQQILRQVTR